MFVGWTNLFILCIYVTLRYSNVFSYFIKTTRIFHKVLYSKSIPCRFTVDYTHQTRLNTFVFYPTDMNILHTVCVYMEYEHGDLVKIFYKGGSLPFTPWLSSPSWPLLSICNIYERLQRQERMVPVYNKNVTLFDKIFYL